MPLLQDQMGMRCSFRELCDAGVQINSCLPIDAAEHAPHIAAEGVSLSAQLYLPALIGLAECDWSDIPREHAINLLDEWLSLGANPLFNRETPTNGTLLHFACKSAPMWVPSLLKTLKQSINEAESLSALLSAPGLTGSLRRSIMTPLLAIASNPRRFHLESADRAEAALCLIRAGARFTLDDAQAALHAAVAASNIELAKVLIEEAKKRGFAADLFVCPDPVTSLLPLSAALVQMSSTGSAPGLAIGYPVESSNSHIMNSDSTYSFCADHDEDLVQFVRFLLAFGADPDVPDPMGRTALSLFMPILVEQALLRRIKGWEYRLAVLRTLVEGGASLYSGSPAPLTTLLDYKSCRLVSAHGPIRKDKDCNGDANCSSADRAKSGTPAPSDKNVRIYASNEERDCCHGSVSGSDESCNHASLGNHDILAADAMRNEVAMITDIWVTLVVSGVDVWHLQDLTTNESILLSPAFFAEADEAPYLSLILAARSSFSYMHEDHDDRPLYL
jgi:hypothetical protein